MLPSCSVRRCGRPCAGRFLAHRSPGHRNDAASGTPSRDGIPGAWPSLPPTGLPAGESRTRMQDHVGVRTHRSASSCSGVCTSKHVDIGFLLPLSFHWRVDSCASVSLGRYLMPCVNIYTSTGSPGGSSAILTRRRLHVTERCHRQSTPTEYFPPKNTMMSSLSPGNLWRL